MEKWSGRVVALTNIYHTQISQDMELASGEFLSQQNKLTKH